MQEAATLRQEHANRRFTTGGQTTCATWNS